MNEDSFTEESNTENVGNKKDWLDSIAEMKRYADEKEDVMVGQKAGFYKITGFMSSILHGEEGNPKSNTDFTDS